MSFEKFKGKRVLIAPYSPLTEKFAKYLKEKFDINSEIYIDSYKEGDKLIKPEDIKNYEIDAVFIFSPNHFDEIYKTIKKYADKNKIYKIDLNSKKEYIYFTHIDILTTKTKDKIAQVRNKNKKKFLKVLSKLLDLIKYKRKISIFIAEGFVDANIKHMYLYYIKNKKDAVLLTDNEEQYKELLKYNLPVVKLFSWRGYLYTALAKKIYLDHFILDYLDYVSNKQITIQLWHGIPIKPIRDRSKYNYNFVVSTSNFLNKEVFKKVFNAKKYLNYGYPRNDILLNKKVNELDLILSDKQIYKQVLENKRDGKTIIIYMPTFRENGFELFPLNFKKLNEEMQKTNAVFYVKLHPYVLDKYRDSIKEENYSNVIFYNTSGDVYPILKYVDILVTDYSSIMYDFLLLNRPMIFFNYDFEEYVEARKRDLGEDLLFDYYKFTPGPKVRTQSELVEEIDNVIRGKDDFKSNREKIKNLFFDFADENSAKRIFSLEKG
ncbi:putative glycerol phosphotransferase [Nautilia profundicola AmH]|uniref:Glycerol phosphotransferase n=1 Tax=Nautilia profundicola (strain ATCC BAA-1463 / DSM 18972 / AmH) TaxID=598659 RepID=B9L6K3_NAUPA|nr:CDP-glycerol glycerophosphotransferase family protein [Nautilia profundicola]ACM92915.1 putative glycerol phosphotransferase [Nautilia profundicola AmH]